MFASMRSGHRSISAAPARRRSAFRGRAALALALVPVALMLALPSTALAKTVANTVTWRTGTPNEIGLSAWQPGEIVTVALSRAGVPIHSQVLFAGPTGNATATADPEFSALPGDDIQATGYVPMGIPSSLKDLYLDPAFVVTLADPGTDIVTGQTAIDPLAYSSIYVESDDYPGTKVLADVGLLGAWSADGVLFGIDILPGSSGFASYVETDADEYQISWTALSLYIDAYPDRDQFAGSEWPADTYVDVSFSAVGNPSIIEFKEKIKTDGRGEWFLNTGGFNVLPGMTMGATADAGAYEKDLYIDPSFKVDGASPDSGVVYGTAPNDQPLTVVANTATNPSVDVTAGGRGDWLADFSSLKGLSVGDNGYAFMIDAEGDGIYRDWRVPNRFISVDVDGDWFSCNDWPAGAFVTVTFDPDGVPGSSDEVARIVEVDEGGNAWEQVFGFDITPGMTVRATDRYALKTLFLDPDFAVTGLDADLDHVSGTAAPDDVVTVDVNMGPIPDPRPSVTTTAGGAGDWMADFGGSAPVYDLKPGTDGNARVTDADGDSMYRSWRISNPCIQVNITNNSLNANEWSANATLTLEFTDPGLGVVHTQYLTVGSDGNGGTGMDGGFRIAAGMTVTAYDPVSGVKKILVLPTDLSITCREHRLRQCCRWHQGLRQQVGRDDELDRGDGDGRCVDGGLRRRPRRAVQPREGRPGRGRAVRR
jgi:hypothetical protein